MYIRVVHCLGSLCGCPAPPQSSNNTHHAHISTPPACTPVLPVPARSPHTREPTRQINRQLATASYAFANGIWLPGKGYINNTTRNRRPLVKMGGEGEGEEVRMGLQSQRVRAKIQHFCDLSVRLCPCLPVWLSVCHSQTGRRQPQQMGQGVPYNSYMGLGLETGMEKGKEGRLRFSLCSECGEAHEICQPMSTSMATTLSRRCLLPVSSPSPNEGCSTLSWLVLLFWLFSFLYPLTIESVQAGYTD